MTVLVALIAMLVALWVLDALLLAAEERGWIYYRRESRPRGQGLGLVAQIYNPEMEHVIEERQSERVRGELKEIGDRPDPGAGEASDN